MKYSLKDLLSGVEIEGVVVNKVVIPMIQRDYAQGREDEDTKRKRDRFLEALHDAVVGDKGITLDFVYGEIDRSTGVLTPLDGQQRLTTLFLLYWYAAKREGIEKTGYSFLENFSYETRASSREFCYNIVTKDFDCDFKKKISLQIANQTWFPLDWKNDPTIRAMLVMLNEIGKVFGDVDNLWEALVDGKRITFYFLAIENMGLTDEIYIKMNSRGKPLTPFEELKAELEEKIREIDVERCRKISSKFDGAWTDLLWEYTRTCDGRICPSEEPAYIVDDAFMNCFRFVCDIISYREKGTKSQGNYFDLIDSLFSSACVNAKDHINELEAFFDCWLKIDGYHDAKSFCLSFVSSDHNDTKIMRDVNDLDIFGKCLKSRYDSYFLPDKVLLYSVVIYLQNQDKIKIEEFERRIRIINNLVESSRGDTLVDREDDRTRIKAVLKQVDSIMVDGIIRDDLDANFNKFQIQEEKSKMEYLSAHPEDSKAVFILENHNLLKGQVGIVFLDENNTVQVPSLIRLNEFVLRFYSLFKCTPDKINCALMTYGNYSQHDGNRWRRRIGCHTLSLWKPLFHKYESSVNVGGGYYKTREVLLKLLETNGSFSDDKLDKIINDFIGKCESEHRYPWEYYFVKYNEFRPNPCNGKLSNSNPLDNPYMFMVMDKEKRTYGTAYIPYMYCALNSDDRGNADKNYYDTRDYEYYIKNGNKYLKATNSGYVVELKSDGEVIECKTLGIPQVDGVDTVNRIDWLKNYLYSEFFVSENIEHQS